jgi:hypothetical protein
MGKQGVHSEFGRGNLFENCHLRGIKKGDWRIAFVMTGRWISLAQIYVKLWVPGTHWIGGWVDPRAVLDPVVKSHVL